MLNRKEKMVWLSETSDNCQKNIIIIITPGDLYLMHFLYLCSPNFRIIRRGPYKAASSPPHGVTLKKQKDVRYCRHCRPAVQG